jgi:pSer/pThr/pTyr-binding forkhead associated (FHA) protein
MGFAMKLLFPAGEHEPVELKDGETVVGSAPDCQIMLAAPGIASRHCVLLVRGEQASVRALDPSSVVVLNGKQISADAAFKAGDLLLFGKVGCRVVASDKTAAAPMKRAAPSAADEDNGRTRVRAALPKYVMRGVSGPTFGKTFGVVGTLTLGRSAECDVSIPSDEISRHHAKLQVVPDGVMVEDLGSANGTFVNNQRVHGGTLMKAGEELRLDTVRFMLMSPEQMAPGAAPPRSEAPTVIVQQPKAASGGTMWLVAGVVVVGVIVAAALRFLGMI